MKGRGRRREIGERGRRSEGEGKEEGERGRRKMREGEIKGVCVCAAQATQVHALLWHWASHEHAYMCVTTRLEWTCSVAMETVSAYKSRMAILL